MLRQVRGSQEHLNVVTQHGLNVVLKGYERRLKSVSIKFGNKNTYNIGAYLYP